MGDEMTPWQRLVEAMHLGEPDHVPVILPVTVFYLSEFTRIGVLEYFDDYKKQLRAQVAFQKRFPDATLLLGISPEFYIEPAAALGCPYKFTEKSGFWVEPIVKEPEDVDKLEVPDPYRAPLTSTALEALEYFRKNIGSEIKRRYGYGEGWTVLVAAPFSIATLLRGITQFMLDLITNQDLAHRLLEISTEMVKEWLKAQEEVIGPIKHLFLACDYSGLISRVHFNEFFVPYTREVLREYDKAQVLFHNDSDTRHLLEGIAGVGINGFHFGPDVDISDAKRRIGDKVCLVGNIHPLRVLLEGKLQDVKQTCMEQISKAAPGGGYVLCPGGEISKGTPLENIDMMIKIAKKYGKYPR